MHSSVCALQSAGRQGLLIARTRSNRCQVPSIHAVVPSTARGLLQTARVAELVGPSSTPQGQLSPTPPSPPPSTERFVDISSLLQEFNPLTESHLLRWGDSDDEDGAEQAEVPLATAWEDGYQGLDNQPSWIDYRGASDSDDPDAPAPHIAGASLAAMLPGLGDPPSLAAGMAPLPNAYSAEAGFQELPPHELEERLATGQVALLLDVRSREEFDSGHIAGAVNLPLDPDLSAAVRAGSLDEFRERPVAVVCASGARSAQATVRLSKVFGFRNVSNVTGGMRAWAREGLPVRVPPLRPGMGGGGGCGGGGGGCGCKGKPAA